MLRPSFGPVFLPRAQIIHVLSTSLLFDPAVVDPFAQLRRSELGSVRMQRIDEGVEFLRNDDRWHKQDRRLFRIDPTIAQVETHLALRYRIPTDRARVSRHNR